MIKLSVIIPVYNEVATLATVLDAVRRVPIEKEIIVVDGNSTDGTREVLEKEAQKGDIVPVFQSQRNGRGGALQEGIKLARGEVIVFQDADLELDPACFPELLAPIAAGESDVVFGSRFLAHKPSMTFLQYWGNRLVNAVLNLLYGTHITDVETCYQMFRRDVVEGIAFDRKDMSFTVELAVKMIRRGLRIKEVPVTYVPRSKAEGKKLYWADGLISLWVLFRYRFFS